MKIRPRTGVGDIELGMTRDEARRALGEPERSDRVSVEGTDWVEWHYDSKGFSVYFDGDEDYRLVTADVDHPDLELGGFRPIGADLETVLDVLGELGEWELVEELTEGGRCAYELVGTELWFWFEDGRCDSVQVSAAWDDDEDDDEDD